MTFQPSAISAARAMFFGPSAPRQIGTHRSKRTDVSMARLCREAADRALADAGHTFADIDAVVVGKAPGLFEGVMMPELYLADALGAVGKPLLRVHTVGSVGIVTANLVQAEVHRRALAVAYEKQARACAALRNDDVTGGRISAVRP